MKLTIFQKSINNVKKQGFNLIETSNVRTLGVVSSDKVTVVFSPSVEKFTIAKLTAQVRMDSLTVTYIPN